MKHILIIGAQEDYHAQYMLAACKENGLQAHIFDTANFPQHDGISWDPASAEGVLHLSAADIPFSQIKSVFWSSISECKIPELSDIRQQHIAQNDAFSTLRTLLMETRIKWCNGWQAFQYHKVKPRQLAAVKALGALIPATYIGNSPKALTRFCLSQGKTIYKPVYGGAHCAELTSPLLDSHHLRDVLRVSPVTIQQYIDGTNVRTFVIGEKVFSAEIDSDATDFRSDEDATLRAIDLPEHVASLARQINSRLGMRWTAIDWRRTPDGEYYFLEANPSPMFVFFEQQTKHPLTETLVSLLAA